MVRSFTFFLLLIVLGPRAIGEEPTAIPKEQPKLFTALWRLPTDFVSQADPSNPSGGRTTTSGFRLKENPDAVQYDAQEYLAKSGVQFPPGSEAFYDQGYSILIVRNTQENLDLVDVLFGGCGQSFPLNIVLEISTFECTLPTKGLAFSNWPTYAELERLPKTEIKQLDRVSAVTKSGRHVAMNHVVAHPAKNGKPSMDDRETADTCGLFLDGEFGTMAEVEPVLGLDGLHVDSNVTYRFRTPMADKSLEIYFRNEFTTQEGHPQILHISPIPDQESKFIVVVGAVRLVDSQGGSRSPKTAPAQHP